MQTVQSSVEKESLLGAGMGASETCCAEYPLTPGLDLAEETLETSGVDRHAWADDLTLLPRTRAVGGVLCIGGFLACGAYHFSTLAERLVEQGVAVRAVSLYGHSGEGPIPSDISADRLRSHAIEEAHALGAELSKGSPLAIVGFSMGALVATSVAFRMEPRPASLLLESLPLELRSKSRGLYASCARIAERVLPAAAWKALRSVEIDYATPAIDEELDCHRHRARPHYERFPLAALPALEELRRDARRLLASASTPFPIHLLQSDHDATVNSDAVFEWAKGRPDIDLHRFTESPHSIALGPESDRYAAIVSDKVLAALSRSGKS